ncbi:hypothetical protein FHQ08_07185 [Lactobacillus sp. CC-MHH1034]|uniref:SpaA isopeptide-forming pilin-related protein n=1 Tax=Agrilactobacillus fermenti TaxID=2586909 RepID=UPI001E283451|nr:SpaA isopeptide-forming pilin-related protein [Agrilactobacillus fermenti]MCD2256502.1 hypothetical protein [Agrilactobacillus fermenti]
MNKENNFISKIRKAVVGLIGLIGLLIPIFSSPQVMADSSATQDVLIHKRVYLDLRQEIDYQFRNTGHAITDDNNSFIQQTFGLNDATFVVFEITEKYNELEKSGMTHDDIVANFFTPKVLKREDLRILADKTQPNYEAVRKNPLYAFLLDKAGNPKIVARGDTKTDTFTDNDGKKYTEDGLVRFTLPKQVTIAGKEQNARYLLAEIDVGLTENIDYDKIARYGVVKLPFMDEVTHQPLSGTLHLYPKNIGYARDPYFLKIGKNQATDPDSSGQLIEGAKFVLWRQLNGEKQYLDMSYESALQNQWIPENQLMGDPLSDPRVTVFTSNSNGLVTMEGRLLAAGTYYFEEVEAAEGYRIDESQKMVRVDVPRTWDEPVMVDGQPLQEPEPENPRPGDANVPVVVNLKNSSDSEVYVKRFKKVDMADHGKALKNAKFVIANKAGKYLRQVRGQNEWIVNNGSNSELTRSNLTILTSDTNGNFEISGLPKGSYKLREIQAPDGYQLTQDLVSFTVGDNDTNETKNRQDIVNAKTTNSLLDLFNPNTPAATGNSSGSSTPTSGGGLLPQTGAVLLNGLGLIGITIIIWAVYRKYKATH